jgi:Protein of unknown function (DUF3467)
MGEVEREQQSEQNTDLPITWHIPNNLQSRYASNVIVQAGQHEIVIAFFEKQFPPLVASSQENEDAFQQKPSIRAECVSRIIVSPEVLPTIIEVLQNGLKAYHQVSKREE